MSDTERTQCRETQDRWLNLPVIRNHIRTHGEHERIAGPHSPTFNEVRTLVLPDWQQWFKDFWT